MRGLKNPRLRRVVVKASPSGEIFIYVKALKLLCSAYQFTHQISASSLNYFLKCEEGPKIRDGVAVVEAPNHICNLFTY